MGFLGFSCVLCFVLLFCVGTVMGARSVSGISIFKVRKMQKERRRLKFGEKKKEKKKLGMHDAQGRVHDALKAKSVRELSTTSSRRRATCISRKERRQ